MLYWAFATLAVFGSLALGFWFLRMLAMPVPPEGGSGTADVAEEDLRYRCAVCGAEVLLTKVSLDDEDFTAPRHCRESMKLVVEAS